MSQDFPPDQPPITPAEIVALADEMHSAGFPEIAEVLVRLAYELADRTEARAVSARMIFRECPAEDQSGWLRG